MRRIRTGVAVLAVLAAAACSSSVAGTPTTPRATSDRPLVRSSPAAPSSPTSSNRPHSTPPRSSTPAAPGSPQQILAGMSEAQRVGQLLMVDCPSTSVASATVTAIQSYHVGSVILDGNSELSIDQTHSITSELQSDAPRSVRLFIATDQEGGLVQRLRGPGFSEVPSALVQGSYAPATLQSDARTWGGQLHAAGVNVDLAPVLDTVPVGQPNPPIGDLDREYGHDPATVTAHGVAAAQGLAAAGVDATVKHFPGLGRVTGNTDTTSGVTDSVTTANDPYLQPFQAAVTADVPFVMMSTAIYTKLDPGTPAAFSHRIVTDLLRDQLGFGGVVISDDLGAAQQVSGYSIGSRAVEFVRAGGDIVLTVNASQAATMTGALLSTAEHDASFRTLIDAAALRVLQAKAARGLLG